MIIDKDACISCGACIETCPVEAISFDADTKAEINQDLCIHCGACKNVCPTNAISGD